MLNNLTAQDREYAANFIREIVRQELRRTNGENGTASTGSSYSDQVLKEGIAALKDILQRCNVVGLPDSITVYQGDLVEDLNAIINRALSALIDEAEGSYDDYDY